MRVGAMGRLGCVLAVGAIATSVWGSGGCALNKQTELVPGVMSQIQVPRNLNTVRVDVQPEGQKGVCFTQLVDPATGGVSLPRTLGVIPNGDNGRLITVTVTGYTALEGDPKARQLSDCSLSPYQLDASAVKILRRSRQRYVGNKILFLPMPLRYSCWEAAQCKDDETCVAGACVPADVDSTLLPEYNDNLVNGSTNTCFSPKQCLADVAPAKVIDQAKCIYAYPLAMTAGSGVNVRVTYDDHTETEILDIDPPTTPVAQGEGFTIPDAAKPQQIQLAPGLCAMVNGTSMSPRRITDVRMATICPPKTLLQPVCDGELAPHSLLDGGQTTDGGCNIANELQPAPSALYVLLDDSHAMAPIYGPMGLSQVLSFSLNDPVFRTTSLAFKLLPHAAPDCTVVPPGPTTLSMSPDVPFDLASKVQPAVAAIVGDATKALATDPPMLIDAALQPNGAYKALLDYRTTKNLAFNRMAVMLILNRPATDDCGMGHAMAIAEAAAAFGAASPADRVFTYVVMLGNSAGTPDATAAQSIATSGGPPGATQFFDARTDAAAGAQAFNAVVSDLGSCLYEKPTNIDAGAVISYTDPLTQVSSSVTFDMTCNEGTQNTANGWNIDAAKRVRICGKACSDLRSVLSNAANFALSQSLPAPNIPVTATQICK